MPEPDDMKTILKNLQKLTWPSWVALLAGLLLAAATAAQPPALSQPAAPAQPVSPAQQAMQSALVNWVAAKNGVASDQVALAPLDARVAVQPCAGGFNFDYPFVGRDTVRVRCTKPNWQLFVKVGFTTPAATNEAAPTHRAPSPAPVEPPRQVVVAAANLQAGQVLQSEHLKLEKLDAEKISKTHYLEVAGLEGQELVRAIRAGEPLRTSDLRAALLVRRGDQVLMTVGTPSSFQISVKVEAMQDGRLGEQIKLRNTESGRTLSAIVTGKGQARGV